MNQPLVSICLPNLNTLPYLQERVDTILGQTYRNWEMVVSDNFSEDGAWEFFQKLAASDPRVKIAQAPREGMYPNWNRCLERATGEYVHIATSDDTMAPNCLEKMVAALETHPACEAAHCQLRLIDEHGNVMPQSWWPYETSFGRSAPALVDRAYVRHAPYDGLLHLLGEHVYFSITEMLYRRSLFSRVGNFESRWGSVSDFNWHMRVGLVASTVHVPDTWASWRIHPKQATAHASLYTAEHFKKVEEMIADAVTRSLPLMDSVAADGLRTRWLDWTKDMRAYYAGLRLRPKALDRRWYQFVQLFNGSPASRSQVFGQVLRKPKWQLAGLVEFKVWLESAGLGPVIRAES